MLEIHVVKRRESFTVEAAFSVASGESCALFGASGAGKSTLLACIAGIETPDDGYVKVEGETIFPPPRPLHRRKVGYLTQDANLFPHLRVGANVRFGLVNGNTNDGVWVNELRERLRLAEIWDAPAGAISGGQARRVALARMLAPKPRLVLLDEPFTGLDRGLVRDLLAAIVDWQRMLRFTMIVVDHEADILERLSRRAIVLEGGRIVADGDWQALHADPATPLLADLLAPL